MKTIKVVLGVILGISAIVTFIQLSADGAYGAELVGYVTGFLLIGGFAVWLIYSGTKSDTKKDQQIKSPMKDINQTQKIIIFITIAIVLFFVAYPLAEAASNGVRSVHGTKLTLHDAFAFNYTWYVWAIYTLITGSIGFFMFRNKPK